MKSRSLRLRLLGLAAVFISLALLAAGIAIALIFVGNVERSVRADLVANLNRLVAAIEPAEPTMIAANPLPDPRYDTPLSGVYWQVESPAAGVVLRSQSLLDVVLDASTHANPDGTETFVTLAGPDNQPLSALIRQVRFGDLTLLVTLAQSRMVLDESIRQFGTQLTIALIMLGAALIVAAALQVWLGLRPLEHVRAGLESVRHGRIAALPDDYPSEIQPMADEVNALLASQEGSVEFARARAADLAHGLKTPLTVMRSLGPRLSELGDTENAALLSRLVDEMDDRVAYQLRLSRLRHRTREHHLSIPIEPVILATIEVLKRTPSGELLRWATRVDAGLRADIDRQDLQELVGTVLENAAKWAMTSVTITAQRKGQMIELCVSDDGAGLPSDDGPEPGKRGHRLDESTEGSGLGLSIAREILAINNGTIAFERAEEGGLMVRLMLVSGAEPT